MSLSSISKGTTVQVTELLCSGTRKQRMMDLGIIKGATISVGGYAPLGDPMLIRLNDCDIAIRKADAREIVVKQA